MVSETMALATRNIAIGGGERIVKLCESGSELEHDLRAADRFTGAEVAARFPGDREAPRRARRLVAAALRRWGYGGAPLDCAVLVSSELATNAVLHARSPFSLTATVRHPALRIAVADSARPASGANDAGWLLKPGHGLAVVETLALDWGVGDTGEGKVVWAELRLS